MRSIPALLLISVLLGAGGVAYADGKRDLEDGIAFYENLDTERALERLNAAAKASDLGQKDRARAHLYLGMVHFENGSRPDAEKAWKSAFELDKNVDVPKGTSPKTIEAIEAARASSTRPGPQVTDEPGDSPREGTPELREQREKQTELPKVTPEDPKNEELTRVETPPPGGAESSSTNWLLWGGIGAGVVAVATVVTIVLLTSGSDCRGSGGCVSVTFQ